MKVCPKCGIQYPDDANFCPTDAGRLVAAPESVSAAAPVPSSPGIQVEVPGLEELYELGERLGGGNTGEVFQATERKTGKVCAIKRVNPELFMPASQGLLQRAERELKQLERVDSPGIARVLGHGKDGDSMWIASELVAECRSARELVEDDGPMEVTRASRIVLAIGQALSDAARLGVIHRDLAPKNVLVLPDDRVKVINFSAPVPTTPKVQGVPEFVSPEQVEGKPADQRSNIYSLGAVFYYLVAGRPPFVGEASELYVQHASGTPEPPSAHVPVPEAVDGAILRALERSASKRYMTLRQFLGVIEPLASGNFEAAATSASPAGKGKAKSKLTDTLLGGYAMAKVVQEAHAQAEGQEAASAQAITPPAAAAAPALAAEPAGTPAGASSNVHENVHEKKTVAMGAVQPPAAVTGAMAAEPAPSPSSTLAMGSAASSVAASAALSPEAAPAAAAVAPEAAAASIAAAAGPVTNAAPGAAEAAAAAAAAAPAASAPSSAAIGTSNDKPAATAAPKAERTSIPAVTAKPGDNGQVAAAASDADSGPASSPEAKKRKAENKAKFRETLWFKKGELDAAAAAAAEAEARSGRVVSDKADLLPVEDRYADDGSLTAGDREKFSLKTGGTETLPAIRDRRTGTSGVSEEELVSELQSGRGKIIAAIVVGLALVGAVVAYAILHSSGSHGSEKAPETKPVIQPEGAPPAPAPAPQ